MGAYINRNQINDAGAGEKPWIPLNRWGNDDYTVNIKVTGTVDYSLEGTLSLINRGVTAETFTINDEAGSPISGATASQTVVISGTPLEALRINQASGAGQVDMHVMQSGNC